jgi:arsenical pump membrane protein
VADGDGLFAAAGARLAGAVRSGVLLFAGSVLIISVVTATLNLDTSVAFLTPVLVHAARNRGYGQPALLYGCLLLSNAASLLLPGSNLTNLIVLGHLHLTGAQFAARMWLPWLCAVAVTAAVVAIGERSSLRTAECRAGPAPRLEFGLGLAAIVAATVIVIVIREPALPVLLIGAAAAIWRLRTNRPARRAVSAVGGAGDAPDELPVDEGRAGERATGDGQADAVPTGDGQADIGLALGRLAEEAPADGGLAGERPLTAGRVWQVLGVPVLAGLFGAAVALGTLGRAWSGPAVLLSHLSGWATAAGAAATTVAVNNLPAASMLAARTPAHPFELLIGLNLGPNLCVTGSLAWILWLRSAREAGSRPSLARASRLGLVAVPLSIVAAVAALAVTGPP